MADQRGHESAEDGGPVPRDLPDQQADAGEDRWEVSPDAASVGGDDVPDTDEAGTGRRGAPHSGAVHPEHPVPDEPSA